MSGQIPENLVDEIRSSNNIVDVVGDYVQLKKQGRNYFGLCPFHGESTPSFSVSPEKQIFHCFGCGKGGNAITFIMEIEGIPFYEAVKGLAEKSGQTLPDQYIKDTHSQVNQEMQPILDAHQWLTKLYHHLLRHTKEGKEGYDYLKARGFSDEIIDAFQLGFAPNSKTFTAAFLEKKGFHLQTMVKAGLLSNINQDQYSDRFRGRVIFPIRNHQGKTVAFGGRTVSQDQQPKYLNSPETDIFHKGRLLYNFDLARSHIRQSGEAILFEGYMDVISAYQAGIKNGVASLGTALTDTQGKFLRRYVDTVIICYDSDNAGIEATYKAANLLKKIGCFVKIGQLKDGMDPDDYIQAYGSESFNKHVIEASTTYMTFLKKYLKRGYNLSFEGDRIRYIESVLDEIAKIEKPLEREHYTKELADDFSLSMDVLNKEIAFRRKKQGLNKDNAWSNRHNNIRNAPQKLETKLLPAFHNAERHLIAYMLKDERIAQQVQEELGGSFLVSEHAVLVAHLYAFYEEGNGSNTSRFIEQLPDDTLKNIVAKLAMIPVHDDVSDREISDYIKTIRVERRNKGEIHTLLAEQKEAERHNDPNRAAEIAMQIIQLKQSLKQE